MNVPTILVGALVLVIFGSIVARGIHNRRHGKSGCSCGGDCGSCGSCGGCHK